MRIDPNTGGPADAGFPSLPAHLVFADDVQRLEAMFKSTSCICLSPNRLAKDLERDQLRNPPRILRFLDIKPNDRILDFSSWDGYWSTLLVPLTRLPVWCHNVKEWRPSSDKTQNPNGTNPYGPLRFFYSDYVDPTPPTPPMCKDPECPGCTQTWLGWDALFDLVFTYNNYHDARAEGSESFGAANPPALSEAFLKSTYRLLRPGGHLVVIDHAAAPSQVHDDQAATLTAIRLHRIEESLVVREVTSCGFELVGVEEDALRVPGDNKAEPAWSQDQPVDRLTDRFALKFRKPGGPDQERIALMCWFGHW
ncbi:hypothetical protein DFJ73DRAFT_776811 [Zopfochytrium polystomum]|nr:hypothetical protein DFJ73DRAFT_776811 [Zopfochytrium polystomum]